MVKTKEERAEYMKKYNQSEKGKASKLKYEQSEKGKETKAKYAQSEKGKEIQVKSRLKGKTLAKI